MRPGFQPRELAPRYNVERFSEDAWHTYSGEKTATLLSQHLAPQDGVPRRLLNAGAGVYELNLPGWTEILVDLFDAPIRGRPHSIRASIEELPFEAHTFGAVVCVGEVLGYCDPARAIAEFARVTVSQGILICDFGTTRSLRYWFTKQHSRAAELVTDQYNGTPEPIWIYDPSYIRSLLAASSFEIKFTYGTHTWSALARRFGLAPSLSTALQRRLERVCLPAACADVMTIVAARFESAIKPR
jgi:SAM-dependent methyltransferase